MNQMLRDRMLRVMLGVVLVYCWSSLTDRASAQLVCPFVYMGNMNGVHYYYGAQQKTPCPPGSCMGQSVATSRIHTLSITCCVPPSTNCPDPINVGGDGEKLPESVSDKMQFDKGEEDDGVWLENLVKARTIDDVGLPAGKVGKKKGDDRIIDRQHSFIQGDGGVVVGQEFVATVTKKNGGDATVRLIPLLVRIPQGLENAGSDDSIGIGQQCSNGNSQGSPTHVEAKGESKPGGKKTYYYKLSFGDHDFYILTTDELKTY